MGGAVGKPAITCASLGLPRGADEATEAQGFETAIEWPPLGHDPLDEEFTVLKPIKPFHMEGADKS